MTRIVFVSDVHSVDIRTPRADILIAAGDMTVKGHLEEFQWLNEWFGKQPQARKFYIPGNHDWLAFSDRRVMKLDVLKNARWLIDEEVHTIGNIRVYGSPWTPKIFGASRWGYPLHGGSHSKEKWDEIPEGLDILVTHGPPYGISDEHWVTGSRLGCSYLRWRLEDMEKRPKVHVFGHIHSGEKLTRSPAGLEGTLFLNAAICGEGRKYLPENPVTLLDYETLEVSYYHPQTLALVDASCQAIEPQ